MKLRIDNPYTVDGHLYGGLTRRLYNPIKHHLPRALFALLGRRLRLPQFAGVR